MPHVKQRSVDSVINAGGERVIQGFCRLASVVEAQLTGVVDTSEAINNFKISEIFFEKMILVKHSHGQTWK